MLGKKSLAKHIQKKIIKVEKELEDKMNIMLESGINDDSIRAYNNVAVKLNKLKQELKITKQHHKTKIYMENAKIHL